jgi:hypothetical protein
MKMINGLLAIFLVFGFLIVPTGVFAQENYQGGSDSISKYISPTMVLGSSLTPQVKGSSGGKSSSSSKIKTGDGDDDTDVSGALGDYWWVILLIIAVIGIILIWYFFLRK